MFVGKVNQRWQTGCGFGLEEMIYRFRFFLVRSMEASASAFAGSVTERESEEFFPADSCLCLCSVG